MQSPGVADRERARASSSPASGSHAGAPGIWGLSDALEFNAAGAAPVAFRFTAPSGTSWQLDDVYVDPRARG